MTDTPASGPRIVAIDTLRGFALLGMLVMNIQAYAMIEAAYFNPTLHMDLTGVNWWVWALSHIFADTKFMAIFSMLFGASVVLLTQDRDARGERTWALHYSRTFWLLIFGLGHTYFIWYGDILFTYAICAAVIYWLRNLSPRVLLIIGSGALCISPVVNLMAGFESNNGPGLVFLSGLVPSSAQIAAEIEAYRGGWFDNIAARSVAFSSLQLSSLLLFLLRPAFGFMIIGMGLFKLGILSAKRAPEFYNRMIFVGASVGIPLCITSVWANNAVEWHPAFSRFGLGALPNYLGGIGLSLAYIAAMMRVIQSGLWEGLRLRLAAVGRMALTNYILQSILCTSLFYGFGLGFFGMVERWQQILIVIAVCALQMWLSPWWLARFRFGPLEWLWRSLTYMRLQPMRFAPTRQDS